ncbi:MAG TPA: hypothetical protein VED41_01235, partial [Solirubrobacteraceae bacterium]|nr:hypothetical protein [Solirubrobacteraceae bacterium]
MSALSDVHPVPAVLRRPHGLLEGPLLCPDGRMVYSDVLAGGVWECAGTEIREILPKRRGVGGVL